MALTRSLTATLVVSCAAFDVAHPLNIVPEHFKHAVVNDGYANLKDDCPGCRSEERVPDSELWNLFNSSGQVLKEQVEHDAHAMGLNAHFEEFVPVRYAEQWVSGQRLFIKVRVQPQVFIDIVLLLGLPSSNEEPTLEGIKVGVDEQAPIDDFKEPPNQPEPEEGCAGCPGGRSEERMPDSQLLELFNFSGKVLRKQAENEAQAMGWNGHFKEFVPVRYADQWANPGQLDAEQLFFVKVRVQPELFIDVLLQHISTPSNGESSVKGIKVGVEEDAPIDEFKQLPARPDEDEDDCDGCSSEERLPDTDLWELFNSSGKVLQEQAEGKARAMGWNGHFKEFVPVRYAVQSVAGQRFFIKVRVQSQLFIDVVLFVGLSPSDAEPVLEGVKVGVDEEAPIDDFKELPTQPEQQEDCAGCPGGRSEERVPDTQLLELFNFSGRVLRKQAEFEAQTIGWNGHFEEFVPVRYADQWVNPGQLVAEELLFVKVRVQPELFIDVLLQHVSAPSNEEPAVKGVKLGVDEEAPIDDFQTAAAAEFFV